MGFVNDNVGEIDPVILAGIFHRQNVIILPCNHNVLKGNGNSKASCCV